MRKDMQGKKVPGICKVFDFRYLIHDFMRVTGIFPLWLGFRTKLHFASKQAKKDFYRLRPYLITANHRKISDGAFLVSTFWHRRLAFVMADVVLRTKGAFWLRRFRAIEVDRDNIKYKTFKECNEAIAHGHCVMIFPEGHLVEKSQPMDTFKDGASFIAWQGNIPILPTYIAMRKSKWHRKHIAIGEAIIPKDIILNERPNTEEIHILTVHLRAVTEQLKDLIEGEKKNGTK